MTEVLINIDVSDLRAAERFYCAALPLALGRPLGSDMLELIGPGARIYLLLNPPGSAPFAGAAQSRDYARHWTPVHLDFVVEDLESAVARSLAAGAIQERPVTRHVWGRMALMADPFGNGYCLLEFSDGGYDALQPGQPSQVSAISDKVRSSAQRFDAARDCG